MSKKSVHVTPSGTTWKVKSAGAQRAAGRVETQGEAIQLGRRIAMNRGAELVVHRKDCSFRLKDSFGNDLCPPFDREQ